MTEQRDSSVSFGVSVCGIEELGNYAGQGVSHLISILDPEFPEPDALRALRSAKCLALRFHDIIDECDGMLAPQADDVEALLRFGDEMPAGPSSRAHLLAHCHAGISRSTAAMILLVAQAHPELPAAAVVAVVVGIRPRAWPNLRIIEMGDVLLGRRGALIDAVRPQYHAIALRDPEFSRMLLNSGRAREVPVEVL